MREPARIRRLFYKELLSGMHIIWPVLSMIMAVIACLGLAISLLEGWKLTEGIYFAFVTALTVGYGDFAPKHPISRFIAITISFSGILMTAMFAAISVRALEGAVRKKDSPPT